MIAILTDRPNVGKEIARVLGAHKRENGYMTGNGYMVTWTFGNMLSLAMPKDSGNAWVEWDDFPLRPAPFMTVRNVRTDTGWNPDINAVLQLKVIARVFDACDTIIAATDASREGEMLFRHIYRFLGCKQPCHRLWISSLTDEAILNGMANLCPCNRFDKLFLAADATGRTGSWGSIPATPSVRRSGSETTRWAECRHPCWRLSADGTGKGRTIFP